MNVTEHYRASAPCWSLLHSGFRFPEATAWTSKFIKRALAFAIWLRSTLEHSKHSFKLSTPSSISDKTIQNFHGIFVYLQHSKSAQCNDCNECTIETTADSTQTTSEDVAYLGRRTRCSSSLAAACTQFTLIKLNSGNFLEISLAPQRISKSQRSKMIKMRASLGEGKDMATHQV